MVALPSTATVVRPEVLTAIAAACRDHDRLRLDYVDRRDASSIRTVEPHRLVHGGQRWYVVAFDLDRRDWRSFRVDRLTPRIPTGPRASPGNYPNPTLLHTSPVAGWPHRGTIGPGSRCAPQPSSSSRRSRPQSGCWRPSTTRAASSILAPIPPYARGLSGRARRRLRRSRCSGARRAAHQARWTVLPCCPVAGAYHGWRWHSAR